MQNNVQLRLDDVTLSQSRIHQPAASPPSHFALYTDLGRSNKAVMLTLLQLNLATHVSPSV